MIGHLRGKPIILEEQNEIIIDVRGVGYSLLCSENSKGDIAGKASASLWVHTHVREDSLILFGFSTLAEKQLFLSLIKVNGIGPKLAIGVLSAMPLSKIIQLIDQGDAKGLMKLPKVGKKTAEQIVLSLKGKLSFQESTSQDFSTKKDIISALVNLGFRMADVEFAVEKLEEDVSVQEGVRAALAELSQ